jgi:type II secretory pathway component PulF
MDDVSKKIEELGQKLDEIHRSVDAMKKFFMWTLIVAAVLFVLPLIGLILVIPQFLSIYSGLGSF